MDKRYVYRVVYKGKVIDKIDTLANNREEADDIAYSQSLDGLDVIFEDEIEEEE